MQKFTEHRPIKQFEAVEDDPNIIGTFVAELGRGGKVNLNRRIYPAQEFKRVNEDLNRRIMEGAVAPGEENHPNFIDGPTFKIPVLLQEVVCIDEGPGVVRSEGRFAITNTQSGRDIKTLHELGVPVGVSSKMYARPEAHTLDRSSEFYSANSDFEDEVVTIMRDLAFDEDGPYDLVRVPSASTYVRSQESVQVREAVDRLVAEGILEPAAEPAPEPAAEAAPTEGADMDLQERINTLEAELKEVRESQEAETLRADEAIARAEKAEVEAREQAEEAVKAVDRAEAAEAKVEELEAAVEGVEEAEYAQRLADLQKQYEATREELSVLRAERETEKRAAAMAKAVKEASAGTHGELVREELAALIVEGTITDPEKVAPHAERIRALCEKAAVKPTGEAKVKAGDDDVDVPEAAVQVSTEALSASFIDHMNRIHAGLGQEN